ncbi:molybdopterin-dependent oxidoreductase [Geomonas sp. Red69]|uniref:Molybdopterin-dependent oxidoreductase n=1 Tax=Geomonas diazotrophica TaxID=2843197 RepID=A0ABX8JFX3_9BACT|nr:MULTISPECIES: molybdopterin-dependent oxidoreductase [Geomonas]MBU5638514.1 molybdopterin-dependent oxidoreductase [Geomonas diazotrophica]QWV97218.1 molybdopterin-dependent oxidoreductase [Geomonas nitrogeniifigens]
MVNLTIDGKQVAVEKDATIYDAAKACGIKIPILCHDKKLHPFGGCRMCLVEVEQMKGRLIPACTTPVTEGMIVQTTTDEIVKARKLVLELLLLKHPIDCPVCDAAGDCDLQNLTYEYKVNMNRFVDEKFNHEIDYENPLIERDMNRCIHCGKCARICDEIVSYGAYTFINRGIEAKMGTEFDGPLNCEFCGSCVSVCPVGALNSRPFKFKARWWALQKTKSVCSYCGTGCQLTLGSKDGKVLTTIYDENQGFHNGQLCTRGRFGYQFVNSEKRLTAPLVRKNGKLQEATWEEALAEVTSRLSAGKSDPASVAALATARLTNEELFLFEKLFRGTVGTDNIDHSAGYAHEALTKGALASFGVAASPAEIADIQKSSQLLVVKSDAYETHPVIGFEINLGVKRKGVALRIVSDKKGKLTRLPGAKTTVHAPGSEVALFNALCKSVIDQGLAAEGVAGLDALKAAVADASAEKAGVTAEEIAAIAKEFASAEKGLIILPIGLGYPGHNAALANAAANLAILTGQVGKEGAGLLIMGEKNNSQGAVDMGIYPKATGLNAQGIIDGCTSGNIKTLFVAGENPVVSYPNRKKVEKALENVEFMVVSDLFLTETAALADVVLPACSFAEKSGTFTSLGRRVQNVRKAIPAIGLAKSDFEILNALSQSLGGARYNNQGEVFTEIAATVPAYKGLTQAGLKDEGAVYPVAVAAKLVPAAAKSAAPAAGKLALVTGSALYHCGTMSRFGEGPMYVCPDAYAELNVADAAALKIVEGDQVTVTSGTGAVLVAAKVGKRVPQGVVFSPYHFGEGSVNTITDGSEVTYVTVAKK